MYGLTRIGNVMADEAPLAHRILLGMPQKRIVTGCIVEAPSDYSLVAAFEVEQLASMDEVRALAPCGLGGWTTSVATIMEWAELTRARLACLLACDKLEQLDVSSKREDDLQLIVAAIGKMCELMPHDLSREMREERRQLLKALEGRQEPELQEAKQQVEESVQRMGGEHVTADIAAWLKGGLLERREVKVMMAETNDKLTREEVEAEAKDLPHALLALWQTDTPQFVSVVYGMRLSRVDVRRLISCMVWLEINSPLPASPKGEENNANDNGNVNGNGRATRGNQTNQEQIKQEEGNANVNVSATVDTELICELMPIFYNKTEVVETFVRAIRGKKSTQVTNYVRHLIASKRINPDLRNMELWDVLHRYELYSCGLRNWNQRIE